MSDKNILIEGEHVSRERVAIRANKGFREFPGISGKFTRWEGT